MNGTVSEYSLPGVDGDVVDGEPVSVSGIVDGKVEV